MADADHRLLLDLDAFFTEHRCGGDVGGGVGEEESVRAIRGARFTS